MPAVQSELQRALSHIPEMITEMVRFDAISQHRQKNRVRVDTAENLQPEVIDLYTQTAALGASDMHFLIDTDGTTIYQRIHGDLSVVANKTTDEGMTLLRCMVNTMSDSGAREFMENEIQDARIENKYLHKAELYAARYAHIPTENGVYAVVRLIKDERDDIPSLENLGFNPEHITLIRRMLRSPYGFIILSGPTGSGKSTTLRTLAEMYTVFTHGLKRLLAIEDPPEGKLPGIQIPIHADKSDPVAVAQAWTRTIAASLRLDPDALIVGEMRDKDSVKTAIAGAETGHLLMATLHANDAPSSISRMVDTLDVPLALITDPQLIVGLIAQRLVPLLCPECKQTYEQVKDSLEPDELQLIATYCDKEKVRFRYHKGCKNCHHGTVGRRVIVEVIRPDAQFMHLFRHEGKLVARNYWVNKMGGITRGMHLQQYLNRGEVDPLEGDRINPLDEDTLLALDTTPLSA
ncbi:MULTISPECIES: ATPase, T2SS/T4P/T4SS family [Yersinia]|uniref:GspE/PulE family protein n=1 Tax=Yersinia TaxID=629 RepID=UPI0016438417|nr:MULTISPECIES: ATPase, T2SS/T4P/T4SS family [Yersinia]MBS0057706.1 Flp pilus assembly complex ATPase component TadA [Yersinia sp. Marseille-Q3913]